MSEDTTNQETLVADERTLLLQRADQMGLKYKKNIPTTKLRDLVEGKVSGEKLDTKKPKKDTGIKEGATKKVKDSEGNVTGTAKVLNRAQIKQMRRREANKLVRCRITCMNDSKKSWQGEIMAVSNSLVGEIKKFVPFGGVETHIPEMLLNVIQDRQFQTFETKKDGKGNTTKKAKNVKEFSVEILPPLTEKQLNDLATKQAQTRSVE